MKKIFLIAAISTLPMFSVFAQSSKVQTAYRNNQEYEDTKDVTALLKAKEAIDLATVNEETKVKAKTWVYRAKVYYNLFQNNLKLEKDKLTSVVDKNEKTDKAYGNVGTAEYEEAGKALQQATLLDKDKSYQTDLNFLGMQIMQDVTSIAGGKYNVGKFDEAAKYFDASYELTKNIMGQKDTNSLYNSILASQKANNMEKVRLYAQKMLDEKVPNSYTFISLYDAQSELKDSVAAMKTLKEGRKMFPNDTYLMNRETEYYLKQGKQQEAIDNLNKAIEKDPNNGQLYLVRGNVFDNLANKPEVKPKNYEELVKKSEVDYKKSTELLPKEFDVWYFFGALYNNWAVYYQNLASNDLKNAKELDAKALDLLKKATPALEKALEINGNDKATIAALRKLYLISNQPEKAEEMKKRLGK